MYTLTITVTNWVAAPTNEAFDGLPDELIENLLLPENIDQLTDILTYHLVAGEALLSSSLSNGNVEMLNGDTASIDLSNGAMINDANVIFPDILASNGILHVIDNVSKTQFSTYISGIILPLVDFYIVSLLLTKANPPCLLWYTCDDYITTWN